MLWTICIKERDQCRQKKPGLVFTCVVFLRNKMKYVKKKIKEQKNTQRRKST